MNWEEYIVPQFSGTDVSLFRGFLADRFGYSYKPKPQKKSPFLGVKIVKWHHPDSPTMRNAPTTHPHIPEIAKAIGIWKEAQVMVRYMLDEVMFTLSGSSGFGCSCGIYGNRPFDSKEPKKIRVNVMTTIDHILGGAEGVIHELGHHKIHALGIHLETANPEFIGNDPKSEYPSPVRFDKLRPMSAVLHAEFSYVYITDFYDHVIEAEEWFGSRPEQVYDRQAYNVLRIGNGIETLGKEFIAGSDMGQDFFDAFMEYSTDVYERSRKKLEVLGVDESKYIRKKT